jgi:hypothetical protein
MAINDQGSTAHVFISNVLSGMVTRLDLSVGASDVTVVHKVMIATGYAHRFDPIDLALGPTGLVYDRGTDVLFVASTVDNAIFSVSQASRAMSFVMKGTPVYSDSRRLCGPSGLAIAANGNLLTANCDAVNANPARPSRIIELTRSGIFVRESNIDVDPRAAFGIATFTAGRDFFNFAAVNKNNNTVVCA